MDWCYDVKMETYVPESKLYTELQEFEKNLDSTISRKKLDLMDALAKPIKVRIELLQLFLGFFLLTIP